MSTSTPKSFTLQTNSIHKVLLVQIAILFVILAVAHGSHHHQQQLQHRVQKHHYPFTDGIVPLSPFSWRSSSPNSRRIQGYSIPSFILASKSWYHHDLLKIRGGSTESDESALAEDVVVVDAVETTTATTTTSAVDIDNEDDFNTIPPPGNITIDDEKQQQDDLPRNLTFAATKPHDGSIEDPDGIPTRFLLMKKNNRVEAKIAFEGTLTWRKQMEVDTILCRPHPKYDVCKAILPHYYSGRDPNNNIILVQRPAMLDFEIMEKNNATIEDLLMHYIYIIEYCWNILDPGPPERVMTNVLDMRGMSFNTIRNQEYIGFGKRFVNMMSENYPGRSYKTLVINAPSWFHALYKIFQPLLRESTRQKIVILKAGAKQDAALKFFLGDSLPKDLISETDQDATMKERRHGSRYFLPVEDRNDCEPGPNSFLEFDMRQLCIEQLKVHNVTMQEVIG